MKKVFLILVSVSILLMIFDRGVGFGLARDFTQIIFSPIEIGLHEVSLAICDKIIFLSKLPLIYRQNQEFKAEINDLQGLLAENQILKNENKVLKEQLGVEIEAKKLQIFARVLGQKADGEKVFILINKGKVDGVLIGDVVVLRKFLIGRVTTVSSHQAEVLPIFSQASKVPVYVVGSNKRISGLTVGEYNSQIKLKEVLQDENLQIGDLVLTSGLGGTYLPDLLIGKVEEIEREENELFQEAKLTMFWDIKELENVFILQ